MSPMITAIFVLCFSLSLGFSRIGANLAFVKVHSSSQLLSKKMLSGIYLPDLPYGYNSLEPHISERTLKIHHDKHHAKYVTTANDMIKGTAMEKEDIVSIIRHAFNSNQALFNNAGQSYNHEFYWNSMKPNGGGKPTGAIAAQIDKDFGSYDAFRKEFANAAMTAFGSGWAWLVATPTGLKVTKTIGANNPLTDEDTVPLLTCDVWEHAYYLDYQNMRNTYVDTFLDHLINWDVVNERFSEAYEHSEL